MRIFSLYMLLVCAIPMCCNNVCCCNAPSGFIDIKDKCMAGRGRGRGRGKGAIAALSDALGVGRGDMPSAAEQPPPMFPVSNVMCARDR